MSAKKIAVLGQSLSGLFAAYALQSAGHQITLFQSAAFTALAEDSSLQLANLPVFPIQPWHYSAEQLHSFSVFMQQHFSPLLNQTKASGCLVMDIAGAGEAAKAEAWSETAQAQFDDLALFFDIDVMDNKAWPTIEPRLQTEAMLSIFQPAAVQLDIKSLEAMLWQAVQQLGVEVCSINQLSDVFNTESNAPNVQFVDTDEFDEVVLTELALPAFANLLKQFEERTKVVIQLDTLPGFLSRMVLANDLLFLPAVDGTVAVIANTVNGLEEKIEQLYPETAMFERSNSMTLTQFVSSEKSKQAGCFLTIEQGLFGLYQQLNGLIKH